MGNQGCVWKLFSVQQRSWILWNKAAFLEGLVFTVINGQAKLHISFSVVIDKLFYLVCYILTTKNWKCIMLVKLFTIRPSCCTQIISLNMYQIGRKSTTLTCTCVYVNIFICCQALVAFIHCDVVLCKNNRFFCYHMCHKQYVTIKEMLQFIESINIYSIKLCLIQVRVLK